MHTQRTTTTRRLTSVRVLHYGWITFLWMALALPNPGFADRADGLGIPLLETGFSPDAAVPPNADRKPQATLFDHGDPTDYEQLMLELINRARAAPATEAARLGIDLNDDLAPGTISPDPKPPLSLHPLLIDAARAHSQWMLDTDTFSHTGINGSSPGDRMTNAGYVFSGSWTWGENIAWGGSTGSIDTESQTRGRHDSLFLSSGHRQNICHAEFDEIGLGLLTGQFTTSGGTTYNALMVTQNYAKSGATPGPRVLGVVFNDANGNAVYDIGEGEAGVNVTIQGNDWHAVTSTSGGYAVPYSGSEGMLRVTFDGGALPRPVTLEIEKTGANIKLDLELVALPQMRVVAGSASMTSEGFAFTVEGHDQLVFDLQYSTNCLDWTSVQTYAFDAMPQELSHQPAGDSPAHFYRLRWSD